MRSVLPLSERRLPGFVGLGNLNSYDLLPLSERAATTRNERCIATRGRTLSGPKPQASLCVPPVWDLRAPLSGEKTSSCSSAGQPPEVTTQEGNRSLEVGSAKNDELLENSLPGDVPMGTWVKEPQLSETPEVCPTTFEKETAVSASSGPVAAPDSPLRVAGSDVLSPLPSVRKVASNIVDTAELKTAQNSLQLTIAGICALVAAIDVILVFGLRPKFHNPKSGQVQSWEPYFVLDSIVVSIACLALGLPADLLLLGISSAFCTWRIITCEELLGGLSNEGVVAVAALCAVSASIDKTRALSQVMGRCLGSPRSTQMGLVRMAIPLFCLGAVFNNTPLVAVFIPIVKDWTARAGFDAGHFMMPLSFFAMLSATLTTMGSSTNLLAVKLVPEAEIEFLDPAPVGIVMILAGMLYCILLAPYVLPSAGSSVDKHGCTPVGGELRDRFTVCIKFSGEGPLLGHSAQSSGLLSALMAPAVVSCKLGDGSKGLEAGDQLEVRDGTAEEIVSMAAIVGWRLQKMSTWYMPLRETRPASTMWRSAKRVQMAMRFRHGTSEKLLESKGERLTTHSNFNSRLEQGWRMSMPVRRWIGGGMGGWLQPTSVLCKLVVPPGGLVNMESEDGDGVFCVMSLAELDEYLLSIGCMLMGMCGLDVNQQGSLNFRGGEVLLVETTTRVSMNTNLVSRFSIATVVDEQPPPASVILSPLDPYRPMLAVLGLISTVVVAAFDIAPLDSVAILIALSSILLGTLTAKDLYASINGQVLLTVAASFGVGSAIYNTGLATCLASGVLFLVEAAGPTAILGALLGLALVLGIFVSNNTVVIMLAPLVKDICKRQDMDLKVAMLVIIYAANLSFATPFSYQTNMMVMPHGKYVFLDYVKFGVPMMFFCGSVALITTLAYWGC